MATAAHSVPSRLKALTAVNIGWLVIACSFGTAQGAPYCLQCLGIREPVSFCNRTSNILLCMSDKDVCYNTVINRGGQLFSTKGCIPPKLCDITAKANNAYCDQGVVLDSCRYCCTGDACNHDKFKYSADIAPTASEPKVTNTDVTTEVTRVLSTTIEPLNCENENLTRCTRDYEEAIFVAMRNPRANFPYFCRQVPVLFQCIAEALTSCCPDNQLAVHDQLTSVSDVMWAQCPRDCDVRQGHLCTPVVITEIITDVIWGNATCETMRKTVIGYQQCLTINIGTCGRLERVGFEVRAKVIKSAVELTCTQPQPEVTRSPPTRSPPEDFTTVDVATTTRGRGCEPDVVEECLVKLATVLTQPQDPDYLLVCSTLLPATRTCLSEHSYSCTPAARGRLEHAFNFTIALMTQNCSATTVAPPMCDTTAARACALDIWKVIDELGDFGLACKMVAGTVECMQSNMTGCTEREQVSLNRTLDIVLKTLEGRCDQVVEMEGDCSNMTLQEGGEEVEVRFHGNRDPAHLCGAASDCQVYVEVVVAAKQSPKCQDGTSIPQIVCRPETPPTSGPACAVRITSENWRETHSVHLAAMLDNKVDGDQTREVTLVYKKVIAGHVTDVMTFGTCHVTVIDHDTSGQCTSLNDPHIKTFDGVAYDNFFEGVFVLYRHTRLPYEVQVLYQRCGRQATCNCGVAVKSGDYVLFVGMCRRRHRPPRCRQPGRCKDLMSARSYVWDEVTPGTRIFKRAAGFDVILPHGTQVRIVKVGELINVWVVPSAADYRSTTGLCGVYDGSQEKDLLMPNGDPYNSATMGKDHFCKAWRIRDKGKMLFKGAPYSPFHPPTYCACPDIDCQEAPTCLPRHLVSTCDINTDEEITFTDLPKMTADDKETRHKRDITEDDEFDFDLDFDPKNVDPSPRKWTAAAAREHCAAYISSSKLVHLCRFQANVEMEYYINLCVQDILLTDDTKWELSSLEGAKADCLHKVHTDPRFAESETDRFIITKINKANCPLECSGNGICDEGSCACLAQYVGESCDVRKDAVPKFLDTDYDGLCNIRRTDCSKVVVYAEDLINSPKLMCHLTVVQVTERGVVNSTDPVRMFKAEYLSSNQVTCSVPGHVFRSSGLLSHGYLVDLSNDATSVSASPILHVIHDPRCHVCAVTDTIAAGATCFRKPNNCIIGDVCYLPGEAPPGDACRVCDPAHSASDFKQEKSFACLGPFGILIIAAVVILVVIVTALVVMFCCCRRQQPVLTITASWKKRMEEGIAHELLHK